MAKQTIQVADKPTLDEVKALLENSGYGLEAIKNALGSSGAVKSVQRGVYKFSSKTINDFGKESELHNVYYKDITISSINVNKSILITSCNNRDGGSQYGISTGGRIIDSTTIRLYNDYYYNSENMINKSWQVIEFY